MGSRDASRSYEEIRKQRLEENKKRMQELGLSDLSKGLSKNFSPASIPRQIKPRTIKETVIVELRRSSRVANNPTPDYREVEVDASLGRRSYGRSSLLSRKYASDAARMDAANKAEKLEKELDSNNPSFVKPMLQSHVSGGFWLGLPSVFCKTYLPKNDGMIVLEDENKEEWETVYLSNKTGLSGGWRGFSLDHGLEDGDALVFELVQHNRFKVHIIRASEPEIDDAAEEEVTEATGKTSHSQTNDNPPEKGSKRKQQLVKAKSDSDDGTESAEVDAGLQKGSKKKQRQVKEKGDEKSQNDLQVVTESSKMNGNTHKESKRKGRGKNEAENASDSEDNGSKTKQKQLTSLLRSKKQHGSSVTVGSKRGILPSNEIIEVY